MTNSFSIRPMALVLTLLGCFFIADGVSAQAPRNQAEQIRQALGLAPLQKGQVEYSTPADADIANCTIENIKEEGQTGVRFIDPNGLVLREFIFAPDTSQVCQWRYFRDGIEVYRDIDSNNNKRADNYRWFNTAGTRWAVDANEDGTIDSWNVISAEEVSAELVAAMATGDQARFLRLLPTGAELNALGIGKDKFDQIKEKALAAPKNFSQAVQAKTVPEGARWTQFSGIAPSTFPSGTAGSTKDVDYYENAVCSVDAGGRELQMDVGTLIRVGKTWRALDCPQVIAPDSTNQIARIFIPLSPQIGVNGDGGGEGLIAELDKVDQQIGEAGSQAQMAALHARRADVLQRLADSRPDERGQWIRGMADSISGAIQQDAYPDGLARLQALFDGLKESGEDQNLEAYVKFRLMTCEYNLAMSNADSQVWLKAHAKWHSDLEEFVTTYPDSPDTAEAFFQLAMENENAGDDAKALARYNEVVTKFPNSSSAAKANGAKTRLQSVGKPLPLAGQILGGEKNRVINLANFKGGVAIVYFWTTWINEPEKEVNKLKEILAKNKGKLTVVGVCLDSDANTAAQFVRANNIPWHQIYEPGGMDSRPANQLGIFSVPTIMVIGKDGNVLSRNVPLAELEKVVENAVK